MPADFALALPRKRFFLEMFTRDISLHDCILDLIDNSIDGLIRSKGLNLDAKHVLGMTPESEGAGAKASIAIDFSAAEFRVTDTCGGIPLQLAKDEVFNFGHSAENDRSTSASQLGAYGIGLKRALFKIGARFVVESHTPTDGFRVDVDVPAWAENDAALTDWRFPLDALHGANGAPAGTTIAISTIAEDIAILLAQPTFVISLRRSIGQTYAPFIAKYVTITLNGDPVLPTQIPLAKDSKYKPAVDTWDEDDVAITVIAGLAARGDANEWRAEVAGWYVLCNGRVILTADKTDLTGWGAGILPQFHSSKSRGFIGITSFVSKFPLKLPWTTTKRSLNSESGLFLRVRERMAVVARPVFTFLDKMYSSRSDFSPEERQMMKDVEQADVDAVATGGPTNFSPPRRKRKPRTTTKVQYDAENTDLELVRTNLRRPSISAAQIGLHTFNYFLDQEGLR